MKLIIIIGNQGFSIGIEDVTPGRALSSKKELLVESRYEKCNDFIRQFQRGELQLSPGCTAEETLEVLLFFFFLFSFINWVYSFPLSHIY